VVDQGQLGSCTGNAIAGAHQFDQLKQGLLPAFAPSRLFIYDNERMTEGTVNEDAGAMIRDGIKSIGKQGVCPKRIGPTSSSKFTQKPPPVVTPSPNSTARCSIEGSRARCRR
jgi:C1A family cysteine protease